jgi:hypothetical protein
VVHRQRGKTQESLHLHWSLLASFVCIWCPLGRTAVFLLLWLLDHKFGLWSWWLFLKRYKTPWIIL